MPWNVYPVAWVSQRNDLLIYTFVFSALLALRGKRFGLALVATSLAVFSKITAAFFPLYVTWKMRAAGKRRLAIGMLLVFVTYLALAITTYLRVQEGGEHLANVSLVVGMLRFPAHWAEHFGLLVVPAPFFTGWLHAGFYGVFLLAVISGARTSRDEWMDRQSLEILGIAFLLSIPTIVTPHLRICGLETFFWILLLARTVSFRNGAVHTIALAAFLVSSVWGGLAAKEIFRSRAASAGSGERVGLYPNQYYEHRDEFVRGVARRLLGS